LCELAYRPVERSRDAIGGVPGWVCGSCFDAFERSLGEARAVGDLLGLELELKPS
jgi:hypothetical protein